MHHQKTSSKKHRERALPINTTADPTDQYTTTDKTRTLGLIICRGTQVCLICPSAEMEEIANPFAEEDDEEEEDEEVMES